MTLGVQEILLSPMWREPSWSWFQLTEGVGVWVKRVFLKLNYDQERIKGLWHDYRETARSQATQHHSVSCPVMARNKARQTPVHFNALFTTSYPNNRYTLFKICLFFSSHSTINLDFKKRTVFGTTHVDHLEPTQDPENYPIIRNGHRALDNWGINTLLRTSRVFPYTSFGLAKIQKNKQTNFFRALAVFCVLHNRTEHCQASLFVKYSWPQ